MPLLFILAFSYKLVKVTGLKITPQNIKVLKNQSLENQFTSWIHKNSAIRLADRPTKRQFLELSDADDNDESNYENIYGYQATEDFDVNNTEETPSYRQVILDPSVVNALRLPRPYPFQPLHVHWHPHMESLEMFPNPIPVHHYRKVPLAIHVPKYEIVPKPYYVPFKASPDYNVMHVDVYHPGLYKYFLEYPLSIL